MQFYEKNNYLLNVAAHSVFLDFILLSLLGGILLTRKESFKRQKQHAKEYNSRRLMELLDYEEQKMSDKYFDIKLEHAIVCAILFFIGLVSILSLSMSSFIVAVVGFLLLILLLLLNFIMVIGFTSFQNNSTKVFYTLLLPVFLLHLIGDEFIRRWEWFHYFIIFIYYVLCSYVLMLCFSNNTFKRIVETIVTILFVFSSPYLYSELF